MRTRRGSGFWRVWASVRARAVGLGVGAPGELRLEVWSCGVDNLHFLWAAFFEKPLAGSNVPISYPRDRTASHLFFFALIIAGSVSIHEK
jgi:hypothetical protein